LVLFGRFVPLLRTFVSLAAGLGEMALGKFLFFTIIGCTVWDAALAGLGYSLGSSYNHVLKDFSDAGLVVAAIAILAVLAAFAHRIRAVRQQRNQ
jgi:membrane protein DedA with SNARE-associated domain